MHGSDHFVAVQSDVLTGLRAAANISIVFCHAALCLAWSIGAPAWYKVTAESTLASVLIGFPAVIGVNTFLTLTAYLAAAQLVRRLQATDKPNQVIWEYYVRRLRRIVPAFYLLLVVYGLMHAWEAGGRRKNNDLAHDLALNLYGQHGNLWWLPTQFFFLNHVLPDWKLVPWTWTLKLQMAFYAVFPWLIVGLRPKKAGFRRRLACAAIFFGIAGVLWRVLAVPLAGLRAPLHNLAISNAGKSAVHSPEVVLNVDKFLYWVWISFVARGPDLATGVLLYLWVSSPDAQKKAMQHALKYQMAALCAAAFFLLPSLFVPSPTSPHLDPDMPLLPKVLAIVVPISIMAPAIVCGINLYLLLRPDRLSSAMANALSSWPMKCMADRSYSVYLFHIPVLFLFLKFVPVQHILGEPDTIALLLGFPTLIYLLSYGVAMVIDGGLDQIMARSRSQQNSKRQL